jgi:hypothetical protein
VLNVVLAGSWVSHLYQDLEKYLRVSLSMGYDIGAFRLERELQGSSSFPDQCDNRPSKSRHLEIGPGVTRPNTLHKSLFGSTDARRNVMVHYFYYWMPVCVRFL